MASAQEFDAAATAEMAAHTVSHIGPTLEEDAARAVLVGHIEPAFEHDIGVGWGVFGA